jgi:hypothetical protein
MSLYPASRKIAQVDASHKGRLKICCIVLKLLAMTQNDAGCIDAYHKQQLISESTLSMQLIFDLGYLFSIADRFYEVHIPPEK